METKIVRLTTTDLEELRCGRPVEVEVDVGCDFCSETKKVCIQIFPYQE